MDLPNSQNQPPATGNTDPNASWSGSSTGPTIVSNSPPQPVSQIPQQQWQEQPPVMSPPPASSQFQAPPQSQTAQDPNGMDSASGQVSPQQPSAQAAPPPETQQFEQEQQPQSLPPQNQYQESAVLPGMMKPQPEQVLFEWQAESRPFLQRRRKHFTTVGLICVLIAMILFFAGQVLPVAVILAVFFLYYVLNSTPPGVITHKLTTYGIRIEDSLYYWEELGRFWFTEKFGKQVLHIEVERFPFRLTILLGDINKDDMQAVLSEVLLFQVPAPTTYEKVAKWIEEKLPIDMDAN